MNDSIGLPGPWILDMILLTMFACKGGLNIVWQKALGGERVLGARDVERLDILMQ